MLIEGSENQVDYRLGPCSGSMTSSVDAQKVDYLKESGELLARLPVSAERGGVRQARRAAGIRAES